MTEKRRVLVTGADGFIGSHLVEELVQQGFSVRAFVLYNSFNSWGWLDHCDQNVIKSVEVFPGDIRDPFGVKQAITGCDIVLHLAALIAIPYSYHSPSAYVETNIGGTLNVLQAARELGIARLIHTSTSEVYGTAQFVPISESHPIQAQSPYAATKVGADSLAMSFFRSFGVPVTIVRPFNTYGPRQSARAVIPTVITQLASGARKLKLGALHPTRDFNFVKDTVRGFIAAMGSEKSIGEIINIGSNFEISIADLVALISEIMGIEAKLETDNVRLRPEKSEVERLWADNSKALKLLGWSPQFAGRDGLSRGLSETIEWFTDQENLKRYKPDLYNL